MEVNQNTTTLNEKNDILPTENLIICEICVLWIRGVNIVIEMPIAENSICYRVVIGRN
jgi:hypothetical protein